MSVEIPPSLRWWRDEPGGAAWLAAIPALVNERVEAWGLVEVGPTFDGSNAAWVAPVTLRDGMTAVLKVNGPDPDDETTLEGRALRHWDGGGAVRLLAEELSIRALLLERAAPGAQLWSIDDEARANDIAAGVLERLWQIPPPIDSPFHRLDELASRWADTAPDEWERHGRPMDQGLMQQTQTLLRELGATQPDGQVVLHQDFHGGNVLRSDRGGWLAIDPKPLVGERAFDLASLIRDRRPELLADPHPVARMRRRIDQLVERLDLDRERTLGWAIAHAVAWGWTEPDMLQCAEWLAEL